MQESLKEFNPPSFWRQTKATWKVRDKIIQDIQNYKYQTAREWGIVTWVAVSIVLTLAEVIITDTVKLSWRPGLTTRIVGGGSVAGLLGIGAGLLTYGLLKRYSPPRLVAKTELKDFITADLHDIYQHYAAVLPAEELNKYWENGFLKSGAVTDLTNSVYSELNPVMETSPLISPGP